jgi:hypothetical protein
VVVSVAMIATRDKEHTAQAGVSASGNWVNYTSNAWLDVNNERYCDYNGQTVGESKDYPYLISSAEELAYLGTIGDSGQFAGKYIQLGAKCGETLSEIDLSAHYWTPINFYGGDNGSVFLDNVAAHFDGNNVVIKGLNIKNTYTEAKKMVFSEVYDQGCGDGSYQPGDVNYLEKCEYRGGFTNGAAVGLFGEIYKAQIANFKLEAPEIELSEQTDICSSMVGLKSTYSAIVAGTSCNDLDYTENNFWRNTRRIEVAGSLIGTARYSMIIGNSVSAPDINITTDPSVMSVGSLVGYLAGFNYLVTANSVGGQISVEPHVNFKNFPSSTCKAGETDCLIGTTAPNYKDGLGSISIGGLVGNNYHSAVMNGYASTKINFDATKLPEDLQKAVDIANNVSGVTRLSTNNFATTSSNGNLYIGGLVGVSNDIRGIAACILNSYSSSDIDIKIIDGATNKLTIPARANLSEYMAHYMGTGFDYSIVGVGGVAGFLYDTAVNTYYSGQIRLNGQTGDSIGFDNRSTGNGYSNNDWQLYKSQGSGYTTEGYYSFDKLIVYSDGQTHAQIYFNGEQHLALGKLFGVVGWTDDTASWAESREHCVAPTSPYDVSSRGLYSDCLGFNTIFLDGYTAIDSGGGSSHTLRGYTVNNNFAVANAGDFPLTPSSTAWKTGYDNPANHVQQLSSGANLLNDLNSGLTLVSKMVETDLGALSTDPATQQALVALGRSLMSNWVDSGGSPVLAVQGLNVPPSTRPCLGSGSGSGSGSGGSSSGSGSGGSSSGGLVVPGVPNTGGVREYR